MELTEQGRKQIKDAENSTNIITDFNKEMSAQICRLDENAKQLLDEENKVTDAMHLVHRNTYKSLCAVEQVKALAEQLAEE